MNCPYFPSINLKHYFRKFVKFKLVNGRYGCVEGDWWKKVAVDLDLREEVETLRSRGGFGVADPS